MKVQDLTTVKGLENPEVNNCNDDKLKFVGHLKTKRRLAYEASPARRVYDRVLACRGVHMVRTTG